MVDDESANGDATTKGSASVQLNCDEKACGEHLQFNSNLEVSSPKLFEPEVVDRITCGMFLSVDHGWPSIMPSL